MASLKDLFASKKVVPFTNIEESFVDVESIENMKQKIIQKRRMIPRIDFSTASNFAKFGSAELYYSNAFEHIADSYPYDGSEAEQVEFLNALSSIELYIFDNLYPRSNGYITLSSNGWGSQSSTADGYGLPATQEFISLRGTMNTASEGMAGKPIAKTFDNSNKFETDIYSTAGVQSLNRNGTRTQNLLFDTSKGITVEFWMKKDAFNTSLTEKEVIFDLWNGETSGSTSYGRFTIFFSGSTAGNVVKTTINSGTTGGTINYQYGSDGATQITTGAIADSEWHHYAFTLRSDASNIYLKNYIDGKLANNTTTALPIGSITGSVKARIGALITSPSGSVAQAGAGKFSGSLDEFRYWKTERTAEQIAKFYITNVFGGANTDISNADLGVYYKFNEGITGTSSYDSVVLDYSGRISNGVWTGYPGSSARNTGSAFILSEVAPKEPKDPLIYKNSAQFVSALQDLVDSGTAHDQDNTSYLLKTLPSFMVDEDGREGNLRKITQIVSSVFDEIYLQIQELNKIKEITYGNEASVDGDIEFKEFPYGETLLESFGFDTSEIFSDQTILEFARSRNDKQLFDKDISEVKSRIYRHIYNNLYGILKSKGTEKSIRNFFRCIGIPEGIVNFNAYSDNGNYTIEDRFLNTVDTRKFINFNHYQHLDATIFQSASSNTNARATNYITGSESLYGSFTSEVNVLFPKKDFIGVTDDYTTTFTTSSIFGFHTIANTGTFDWPASGSDTSLSLVAIRESDTSPDAKFVVLDRLGSVIASSDYYKDVYANNEWTFAISVYNAKDGLAAGVGGVVGATTTSYVLSFSGYNTEGYYVKNSFNVTASVTGSYLTTNKRYFIGAERQNFTGSVVNNTDVMIGFARHYNSKLEEETILAHSKDRDIFGVARSSRNRFLFGSDLGVDKAYIPQAASLAFNIDFQTITGSDSNGKFYVLDYSSGSTSTSDDSRGLYAAVGTTLATQHEFVGYDFSASSTAIVSNEKIIGSDIQTPEHVSDSDLINILTSDDETFTRDFRPESIVYILEKSHGAAISKEMVNFFGNIEEFNNIIGNVSSLYRQDYFEFENLRKLFFERIQTVTDFNAFFEFYKWIDDGILNFIRQLIPETNNFKENVSNVVESHILERNKIFHKFPLFDQKIDRSIGGSAQTINDLSYDWKHSHAPVDSAQNTNINWWQDRAEPKGTISSGDATIDKQRSTINNVQTNRNVKEQNKLLTPAYEDYYRDSTINPNKPGTNLFDVSVNKQLSKNLDVIRNLVSKFTDAAQQITLVVTNQPEVQTVDDLDLGKKKRLNYAVSTISGSDVSEVSPFANLDLAKIAQFSIYSSSLADGYQSFNNGQTTKLDITNYHLDNYDGYSAVMQGPFTDAHVGGLQHRHQTIGSSGSNRAEALKIAVSGSSVYVGPPQAYGATLQSYNSATPLGIYSRDGHTKRPVNISNIKFDTGSYVIGNYTNEYEFLLLGGRSLHNSAFIKSGGFSTASVVSPSVSGAYDYTKPTRDGNKFVIVERFSAPGGPETAGDNQGGPGLDYEAAEFSPYNCLNFRNLTIRQWLNRSFLVDHANYGGFNSDQHNSGTSVHNPSTVSTLSSYGSSSVYGIGQPSFHKRNRNTRKKVYDVTAGDFVTGTTNTRNVYDNEFIQTNVPNSDAQYAWIAESYSTSSSRILNYQSEDGYVSTSVGLVEEIVFLSSSEKTARLDFAGLNLSSYSGSTVSISPTFDITTLTLSSSLSGATINDLLLNNNGPYGYSSFKQNRTTDYRLSRYLNQSNLFTFEEPSEIVFGSDGQQKRTSYGVSSVATQSILSSKFKPIEIEVSVGNKAYVMQTEFGNHKTFFHTGSIDAALKLDPFKNLSAYDSVHKALDSDNFRVDLLSYKETVWPKEENAYLSKSRQRNGFENNFWRDDISDRTNKGTLTKNKSAVREGYGYPRSSWDLDVYPEFLTADFSVSGSPSVRNEKNFTRPGILQNYTTFNKYDSIVGVAGEPNLLQIEPTFARPQMESLIRSVVSPNGMDIYLSDGSNIRGIDISSVATTTSPAPWLGSGQAKWQANEQSGKFVVDADGIVTFETQSKNPFYDSYDDFAADIKSKAKGYAIIPEFRRSVFASDEFEGKDIDELGYNLSIPNSETEELPTSDNYGNSDSFYSIFTNSDFLKYFEVVKDKASDLDFKEDSITLRCKAIKKFVPYDGFYPAERTVQIVEQFFDSYREFIDTTGAVDKVSDTNDLRPVLQTMFAPGLLYNTIKSGIAIDYPIFTHSVSDASRPVAFGIAGNIGSVSSSFDDRIPFEALYEPEKHLSNKIIFDNEPLARTEIGSTTNRLKNDIGVLGNTTLYKYMINNFLAESSNLFLANGRPTTILSIPENDFKNVTPGLPYAMRIKMFRSMSRSKPVSGSYGEYPVPQISSGSDIGSSLYVYLPTAFFDAVPKDNKTFGEFRNQNPGPLHNLTSSAAIKFTLSSSYPGVGTFEITSSKSSNTARRLDIYPASNDAEFVSYFESQTLTEKIMKNLVNSINSSSNVTISNARATYLGTRNVKIDASDYSSIASTDLPSGFGSTTGDSPYIDFISCVKSPFDTDHTITSESFENLVFAPKMAVIKIEALDVSTLLAMTISSSVTPDIPYLGVSTLQENVSFFVSDRLYGGSTAKQIAENSISSNDYFMANNVLVNGSTPISASIAMKETLTMYSRPTAFGPPVAGVGSNAESATVFSSSYDFGRGYNMPFTPPYYDGEAWMDIVYVPEGSFKSGSSSPAYRPSISSDVLNSYSLFSMPDPDVKLGSASNPSSLSEHYCGIYYKLWRFDKEAGNNPGTDLPARDDLLNSNAMQLAASINPFKIVKDKNGNKRWAIQLKYETPVLNFAHLTSSNEVFYPNGENSGSVPRGIWHQFGRIPKDDEGIYLQVEPIPTRWLLNHPSGIIGENGISTPTDYYSGIGITGSSGGAYAIYSFGDTENPVRPHGSDDKSDTLDTICGFTSEPVKIGNLPQRRTVREAIVAIPYVEIAGKKKFFEIEDRELIDATLDKLQIPYQKDRFVIVGETDVDKENSKAASSSRSLVDQLKKMSRYNFPPSFDFINRRSVTPMSMYIFEFEHTFKKDDLSCIWQNTAPDIGIKFEETESTISHPLMTNQTLGSFKATDDPLFINDNINLPENLKWMVFKVKQKAKTNYKKDILEEETDFNENLYFNYNWPYDHFSLIELAQITAEVDFKHKQERTQKTTRTQEPPPNQNTPTPRLIPPKFDDSVQEIIDFQGAPLQTPQADDLVYDVPPSTPPIKSITSKVFGLDDSIKTPGADEETTNKQNKLGVGFRTGKAIKP